MFGPSGTIPLHELGQRDVPDQSTWAFFAHVVGDNEHFTALLDNVTITQASDHAEGFVQLGCNGDDVTVGRIRSHVLDWHQHVIDLHCQHVSLEVQASFHVVQVDQTYRGRRVNWCAQAFQRVSTAEVQVTGESITCFVDRLVADIVLLQVELGLDVIGNAFQVIQFGSAHQSGRNQFTRAVSYDNGRCSQVSADNGRRSTSDFVLLEQQTRNLLLQGDGFQVFGGISSQYQRTSQRAASFVEVVFEVTASCDSANGDAVIPTQSGVGGVDPDETLNKISALWICGKTTWLQALNLTNNLNVTVIAHVMLQRQMIWTILSRGLS